MRHGGVDSNGLSLDAFASLEVERPLRSYRLLEREGVACDDRGHSSGTGLCHKVLERHGRYQPSRRPPSRLAMRRGPASWLRKRALVGVLNLLYNT